MAGAHGPLGFQSFLLFRLSGAPQTIEIIEIIEIGGVGGPTPEPQDLN